jgi:hypothetical protein
MNAWIALKRPLFLAFLLGCTVSFLTVRTLSVRLIVPGMIYWSFVPLIEIGALIAVCRGDHQNISLPRLIDSFFSGYRPWFLWLTGMCAIWSLLAPAAKSLDWTISVLWLFCGVAVAVPWSAYIDFRFFTSILRRDRARAARELVIQRLISWSVIMLIVGGPTIWSSATGRLW